MDKKTQTHSTHHSGRTSMKWQQECAAINQQKARNIWWAMFRRRCIVSAVLVVGIHALAGGWWLWQSGQVQQAGFASRLWVQEQTMRAGFELRKIKIDGLENLKPTTLMQAANLTLNDPMLWLSVEQIKKDITQKLPEVHTVKVERHLPDALYIRIEERHASALWQYHGRYQLIDQEGTVLTKQERQAGKNHIVLAGVDVPRHAKDFLQMIDSDSRLRGKVMSAKRIGKRRWDVTLTNGLTVKLPQQHINRAWTLLAQLVTQHDLLRKDIATLDMRIEDRIFVGLSPEGLKTMQSQSAMAAKLL